MAHNNHFNKGIQAVQKVTLSDTEKDELMHALKHHMGKNPVQGRNPFFSLLSGSMLRYTMATLCLLILIGGGVCVAAEKTIPGDLLYPVKIHVNEPIQSSFQKTPSQKAAWEEKKIERRKDEAKQLEKKEKTNEKKVERDLQKNLKKNQNPDHREHEKPLKKEKENKGNENSQREKNPMKQISGKNNGQD